MYIDENNKEFLQSFDEGAAASSSCPCPTLFSSNPQNDDASMISPL
jgi:hypothetical protein